MLKLNPVLLQGYDFMYRGDLVKVIWGTYNRNDGTVTIEYKSDRKWSNSCVAKELTTI